jgi:integrase
MATIKIVLDQRRAKINETFPVVLRIRHKDRYFDIKTNYCICKNLFDEKKQIIVGNMDANFNIEEQKEMYSKRIREFLKENHATSYDINTLKRYVLQKPAELTTIEDFWKEVIQQLLDSNRTGTARSYITTLSVISKIIDCNCKFSQVSYKDLIIIETTLLKRGVSVNGIAVYMRTFRAICNRAILYNVASYDWYPFRKYKIKKEKTTPRTISINEMQLYFNYKTHPADKLYKSWCIGKLIFMLRGINLTDLLLLKKSNVHNDRIIYKRAKTGKMYSVKILPQAHYLITEFTDNTEYLFGSLMSHYDKPTLQDGKLYADFRKKLNKKLKMISKLLEIETPITTYVFRYSYANIAKQLGYSKDLIAEALGHEYGNAVTGIYLEMFDNDIVDSMNEQVLRRILQRH